MKRSHAVKIHQLLQEIEAEFELFRGGTPPNVVVEAIYLKVSDLRDVLWHVLPNDIAEQMDIEDGLPLDRGKKKKGSVHA